MLVAVLYQTTAAIPCCFVVVPMLVYPLLSKFIGLRKRRRQNWHNKRRLKCKETARKRKTKDDGAYEPAPAKARRQIFINDKLKVVLYYRQLKAERKEAEQTLHERIPKKTSAAEREKIKQKKLNAKKILQRNIIDECRKKFHQLGKCGVWKWDKACTSDGWEHIPESDRVRWVEVPNSWRTKMGLAKKGRSLGGHIPMEIQVELDKLLAQHVLGISDVTERKEVVSWGSIDAWTIQKIGERVE